MTNKRIIMFFTLVGMTIGSFAPTLLGSSNLLDGWSLICSFIGGIVGIYLGVKIAKRF